MHAGGAKSPKTALRGVQTGPKGGCKLLPGGCNCIIKDHFSQKCRYPFGHLDFCYVGRKGLERINPTVLWTVGRHRLDGGETTIFAKGENANESLTVYHEKTVVLIETTVFSTKSVLPDGINPTCVG